MTNDQRKTFLQYLKTDNTDGKWLLTSDRIPVDCATGDCDEHNKRLIDPLVMERLTAKLAKKVRKRARSEDQDNLKIEYDNFFGELRKSTSQHFSDVISAMSEQKNDSEEIEYYTGSYFGVGEW